MRELSRALVFDLVLICLVEADTEVTISNFQNYKHTTSISTESSCKKEFSIGEDQQSFFKWDSTITEGIYDSQPPCRDKNSSLIKRLCRNGQWYPVDPPKCFLCYKPFITMDNSCIYITEPRTYDSGCSNVVLTPNRSTTEYLWTAIKRKIHFGPLEYDNPGKNYGKFLQDQGDFDCIVEKFQSSLMSVNCSNLFSHKCMPEQLLKKQYHNIAPMEIILKFNRQDFKMFLIIYSPELILTVEDEDSDDDDDEDEAVYCFTDAKGNLKEKVEVEKVYDSRNNTRNQKRRVNYVVYELDLEDDPGQYWCEVFSVENYKAKLSNTVTGFKQKKGNEYAMRIIMMNFCDFVNCTKAFAYFKELEKFCYQIRVRCRLMEIFNLDESESDILVHISSKERRNVIGEYYRLKSRFERFNVTLMNVVYFKSSEVCLPEVTAVEGNKLSWPLTSLGSISTPRELCINQDGLFLRRNCEGNFLYGAKWSEFNDTCFDDVQISATTRLLYDTITQNLSIHILQNVSSNPQDLAAVDLSLIADGLYQISLQTAIDNTSEAYIESVNNVMNVNPNELKLSQLHLNSTDKILDAIESFLKKPGVLDFAAHDVKIFLRPNFLIHATKPFKNNITGIALYGNSANSFLDYSIININISNSFGDMNMDDLELATYVPYDLLQSLSFNLTQIEKESIVVITTVFIRDSLFNQNETNMTVYGKVVGVTIPGFGTYLKTPLPLLFKKSHQNQFRVDCGFWNYGQDSESGKGSWSTMGENYLDSINNDSYVNCAFSHLTHFALLILSERVTVMEEVDGIITTVSVYSEHEWDLSIITAVGCILSFFGILGIFLTAALFKKWRSKIGSKILLQLSVIIILEIIATQIAGSENWLQHKVLCTVIGVLLQYIVLSQFSWMLVIAYLQYIRFVKILGPMPPRLLLKSMMVGWLLPLVPVVFTISFSRSSYSAGYQKFCYPKGIALYLGLIAPATITVLANICIFLLIMYNVTNMKAKQYSKSKKTQKLQIYLAILLFFMLGLHWIFGIMAEILSETWIATAFIYLFCLTATLQGFVLFIFYIVLDNDTRLLWITYIKSCC